MRRFCPQVTPSLVISLLALFVALGGTAIAATGGNFILGQSNTATTRTQLTSGVTTAGALAVTNTGGRPAANFISNAGVAPISVSNATRILNLNADRLDGIDSTGFLPVSGKAADSNLLDGLDSTAFQPHYARTVIVSPVGTPAQNGAALVTALAGITTASAANPFLIKVEPGVYQVTAPLQMTPFVDIEGSGQDVTTIEGAFGGSSQSASAVVWLSANAELRELTVANIGASSGQSYYTAVYVDVTGSARDVTASATASSSGGDGYGIFANSNSTASFYHVTATAQGGIDTNAGLAAFSAHLTIIDSTLTGSGGGPGANDDGLYNATQFGTFVIDRSAVSASGGTTNNALTSGSATIVRNSVLTSSDATVRNVSGNTRTIDVAESQLAGGTISGPGIVCAGNYDENYAFSASTCP